MESGDPNWITVWVEDVLVEEWEERRVREVPLASDCHVSVNQGKVLSYELEHRRVDSHRICQEH